MNTHAYPIDEGLISGDGVTQLLAKYIAQSGVVEPNALTVAPLSSPDMKLEISGSTNNDHLVILKPSGGYLVGWNLEPAEVDIAPNITGVTKTDAIVAYFDLTTGDEEVPEAPSGLKFMVVRRPSAETGAVEESQIDSEVGHTYWHRLANQPVPHNATTIFEGTVSTRQRALLDGALIKLLSIGTAQLATGAVTPDKTNLGGTSAEVLTSQSRNSATFGDLATVGPEVTVTVPASGKVLIVISSRAFGSVALNANVGFAMSGENTGSPEFNYSLQMPVNTSIDMTASWSRLLTGLTPGSTTFTLKYAASTGTATFGRRIISVIPLS